MRTFFDPKMKIKSKKFEKTLDKTNKIWYNTELIRADARLSAMQILAYSMVE